MILQEPEKSVDKRGEISEKRAQIPCQMGVGILLPPRTPAWRIIPGLASGY